MVRRDCTSFSGTVFTRRRPISPARTGRVDALVVDDWAMAALTETERRDFWEICEERFCVVLILTSLMPVARWHEQIGDPTVADGILDRLIHQLA